MYFAILLLISLAMFWSPRYWHVRTQFFLNLVLAVHRFSTNNMTLLNFTLRFLQFVYILRQKR